MFTNTKDLSSSRVSILVHGPSGAGKTSLAKTIKGKPLIVNAENGLLSLAGSDIDVYDITVDREGKELPRHLRFEKLLYLLKDVLPNQEHDYDWLVFDSLTEIAQNLVEFCKKKHPDKSDALKMWGEYNDMLTGLVKSIRDYKPFNILMICLDSTEKDETGRRFTGLDVQGKISNRIPALFDEVFYLKLLEEDDGSEKRVLLTTPYKNIVAKDRSGKLDKFEAPDISLITNKILKGE